jgi:hypothetical protein
MPTDGSFVVGKMVFKTVRLRRNWTVLLRLDGKAR